MTNDLCRFFVDPGTVGLRPGLQPKLSFFMLLCRSGLHPSGSRQRRAAPQTGKWKCSFRTCLKQVITAGIFGWSYRGFKKLGKANKKHRQHLCERSKVHFKSVSVFSEQTACGIFFFCFLNLSFFILSPDYCKNTLNSYLCLLVLASHSPEHLWHLYLPFSRELDSQLKNPRSVFIYCQSAPSKVTTQGEERDGHPGTSGKWLYGWYNPVADPDLWKGTGLW